MAVDSKHLDLFQCRILGNRKMTSDGVEGNINSFAGVMENGLMAAPLFGSTTVTGTLPHPVYGSSIFNVHSKIAAVRSDSGVTCSIPVSSRKRYRDSITVSPPLLSSLIWPAGAQNQIPINGDQNRCGSFSTVFGGDLSFQIQQQQLEIDRFIAQHTEKLRKDIEERRRMYSRQIAAAVEGHFMKRMKVKEDEIEKMGKVNMALEDRVRVLSMENQIWRDLAQTNEAAANALRCDLEQVIAQMQDEKQQRLGVDDAQSSCGGGEEVEGGGGYAMCRSCGKMESCVLVLPCRHLCLCIVCGSSLHICPICKSTKTASVHVNLSSS